MINGAKIRAPAAAKALIAQLATNCQAGAGNKQLSYGLGVNGVGNVPFWCWGCVMKCVALVFGGSSRQQP